MLNIAIVGCGYWGPNLIRNFNSLNDCMVKAVCDIDDKRLSHLSKLYPSVKTVSDYEEIINDDEINAIAIATPVSLHYPQAKKALGANKHVFIEKPMAASVKQCEDLIENAERHNVIIMVGHTFIFTPAVRKISEIISKGELGNIFYIRAQRLNLGLFQSDINVAWDLAPHDLSIILYIMKKDPIAVNCQGKCHVNPGIEDVINMTLDFPNGGFAIISNSWLDPNKVREMTIIGSKRMIVYDDTEPLEKIKVYDKRVEAPPHYNTFAEFTYSYHYGDMYAPYIKQEEPLKIECQHFVDCIRTRTKPITSGVEGLKVVQILEASSESLRQGGARVAIKSI